MTSKSKKAALYAARTAAKAERLAAAQAEREAEESAEWEALSEIDRLYKAAIAATDIYWYNNYGEEPPERIATARAEAKELCQKILAHFGFRIEVDHDITVEARTFLCEGGGVDNFHLFFNDQPIGCYMLPHYANCDGDEREALGNKLLELGLPEGLRDNIESIAAGCFRKSFLEY